MKISQISRLLVGCILTVAGLLSPRAFADTLYTITNPAGPNSIAAFHQDTATGLLTLEALYPTGGIGNPNFAGCSQDTLVRNGEFLYAVNAGSHNISSFRIKQNGTLERIGDPVPSGGITPITLAASGRFLYVANQGDGVSIPANYTGFSIENGQLRQIPGSAIQLTINALPADLRFTPDGRFLAGTRVSDDTIDIFRVGSGGLLERTSELTGQFHPFGMEFNPASHGQLVIGLEGLPGSASYHLSRSGEIETLQQGVDVPAIDSCWVQIRRDGELAWLSGFFGQSVTVHRLGANGSLEPLSLHTTAPFGLFTSDILLDLQQRFMYAVLPGSGQLHVMKVTGDTADGGLADVSTNTLPPNSFPMGLVIVDTRK